MNPKYWLAVCTIALMLTFGSGFGNGKASAEGFDLNGDLFGEASGFDSSSGARDDAFLSALGAQSNEEVQDALYAGQSLADIAADRGSDPQSLIDLQIGQLTNQLKQRLLQGNISWEQYQAYKAEVPELIAASTHVKAN